MLTKPVYDAWAKSESDGYLCRRYLHEGKWGVRRVEPSEHIEFSPLIVDSVLPEGCFEAPDYDVGFVIFGEVYKARSFFCDRNQETG